MRSGLRLGSKSESKATFFEMSFWLDPKGRKSQDDFKLAFPARTVKSSGASLQEGKEKKMNVNLLSTFSPFWYLRAVNGKDLQSGVAPRQQSECGKLKELND